MNDTSVKSRSFINVTEKILSLHWMDNNEELQFTQDGNVMTINITGYQYGDDYVVRVAECATSRVKIPIQATEQTT